MNFDSNFKLTTQAQYLDFNKDEKQQYSVFLESYNAHIERIAQAFYIKDITLLHNSEYLSSTINQRFHLDELSKLYNNRLNDREHSLLFYQSFLEFTLAVLSLTLLFCCIMAYYTMIKENRSQSYFRQLYSTLVENVDVGIAIFDHHKNYVFMNSMYREILSIPLDYKVVKSLSHVLGDDKAKFIWDMVSNKSKASGELDLKIGGCEKHISYDYFIINDEYGYERYIHIIQDFTNMEGMQKQLVKQLQDIEYFSKAKDSFIANFSHEIKTPINAILGMVHFLKSTQLTQNQINLIKKIETSSDILLSIINDVLDLSKIKMKSINLYPSDFSLNQVLKSVEDMFYSQSRKKGISFVTDYDFDEDLCIHLDKTRFVQILTNLISNALKFTDSGYIKLSVETLSVSPELVNLRFCVEDTGIGISKEDMSKLFQEFEQLENHLTKQHQGTGLGLYICKHIVESMGGNLWVRSVENVGSKFYFTLPAERCYSLYPSDKTNGMLQTISMDSFSGKVLVVEDTEINMEVVVRLLDDVNISCDTATNGQEAIELCKENGPDYYKVILMDIHMPVMDGYTSASIIRKNLKFKTPIVALTATAVDHEVIDQYEGVIDDFILKPFKASAFYKSISKYFAPLEGAQAVPIKQLSQPAPEQTVAENNADINTAATGTSAYHEKEEYQEEHIDPFAGREEAIKNLGGLEAIYHKHVAKFKTNYSNSAEEVKEFLENGNYDEARRLVHSIKGLGGTLGMLNLQDTAATLEQSIINDKKENFAFDLDRFSKSLYQVINAI
jgi:signal transduction histidine kinase/HPt (histidine-containing phosphotransfer) domain-containing protein/response regulator of citrate/malate metabolism